MGRKFIDLTGQTFGRLRVLNYVGKNKRNQSMWLCECACENKTHKIICSADFKCGNTQSCGCLKKESTTKHGDSNKRLYTIYKNMKSRCYNEKNNYYVNYGGRGVLICDEWLGQEGYIRFKEWSILCGYTNELTIDRVNVDGNYEPSNCRWTTMKIQQNNRRNNVLLNIENQTKTMAEWSDETSVAFWNIQNRRTMGWDNDKLLSPTKKKAELQSGVVGINWHKGFKRWGVRIRENGKEKNLGYFIKLEDAIDKKEKYRNNKE